MTTTPPPRRRDRRPVLGVLAIVAVVAVVVSVGLLGSRLNVTPSPSPSPSIPSQAVADLPPAAIDGQVIDADLAHDSRDDLYRTPFGAVPAGTTVTLRLRAAAGDLSTATVRVWDAIEEIQALIPMSVVATDATAGDHGFDYWEATLRTSGKPTILYYRFIVGDGPTTRYVEDDPPIDEGNDGGAGVVYPESVDSSWQIDVYDPAFVTPEWAQGAVAYQIFPDRFADGDTANDPSPDAVQGTEGAAVYRYGDVYGNAVLPKAWTDLPEGYCRAYQGGGTPCAEDPLGRDFFGGDLKGITDKLDDLKDLGVTVLYLNPIFAAPSNHRYDTSDYRVIDPDLGTQEDFDRLVAQAKERGIRVLLDGVFNHVSSDSPWFDRQRRFAATGACEAAASPFRAWFRFRAPGPNEPAPCAASAAGDDTYYDGWFGFDTIPELVERPETTDLFTGADGVVQQWIRAGTAGWRLDVMDNLSHGFMRKIREAAKAADPDALVLGEQWGDTSPWLLGGEADSTMNYRFRRAVIGLLNGRTADLDGAIDGLTPSEFAARMDGVREDYPAPAWDVLLNLVDSHDTTRILWTLTPGEENRGDKEDPANLAAGKAKLRLLAALQLTWPGMASIYYGTEVGLTGQDDPDDRRPYPWDARDTDLRDWYKKLGHLRADHDALLHGDLAFVNADDKGTTLAFARRTASEAAVTVLNLATEPRDVVLALDGILPPGTTISDELGDAPDATVGADGTATVTIPAQGAAVYMPGAGEDLTAPGAPTGLTATAAPGQVELVWQAPDTGDAAGYRIWRSLVAGGGYVAVGDTPDVYFVDPTARNGTGYHYVVTALDDAGNVGARSGEAAALPMLTLADARLQDPGNLSQPLSAAGDGAATIAALVTVDNVTPLPGATVGIVAQLGFGAAGASDPESDFTWSDMTFDSDVDEADRLIGSIQPTDLGTWTVVLRVSTDGRRTWHYADRGGIVDPFVVRPGQAVTITTVAGADASSPAAPLNLVVKTVTDSALTLAWAPVTAADLFRYEISRGDKLGGPFERIGSSIEPTFTDSSVGKGTAYAYVVTAVDTSFNRSPYSVPVAAEAQQRAVKVTFTATLPADTPPGDTIYMAGDFQGWDPAATPMTKVDDTTWSITLPFVEGDPPQYKYTRGSWDAVEKDAGCAEIPNRTVAVTFGTDGTQTVADTVAKWRDIAQCG